MKWEIGSHNLGYFPINNGVLPREKKHPKECQQAREETLGIILETDRELELLKTV